MHGPAPAIHRDLVEPWFFRVFGGQDIPAGIGLVLVLVGAHVGERPAPIVPLGIRVITIFVIILRGVPYDPIHHLLAIGGLKIVTTVVVSKLAIFVPPLKPL